jgi:hypothetical protein
MKQESLLSDDVTFNDEERSRFDIPYLAVSKPPRKSGKYGRDETRIPAGAAAQTILSRKPNAPFRAKNKYVPHNKSYRMVTMKRNIKELSTSK